MSTETDTAPEWIEDKALTPEEFVVLYGPAMAEDILNLDDFWGHTPLTGQVITESD